MDDHVNSQQPAATWTPLAKPSGSGHRTRCILYLCTVEDPLAVHLTDACPLMREALALGRECGLVYGVLWEAAWHDQRGDCGGTTSLSHKAIADLCHISKTTVLRAIDRLLDDGLISFLHMAPTEQGSWKRRYRVVHPTLVEAQRAAIGVIGTLPSQRAKEIANHRVEDVAVA